MNNPVASHPRIWPVLLSGGSGTRLWPLSRTLYPKQLLPLAQEETMLQVTALRAADADRYHEPIVVAGEDHRFLIERQLDACKLPPAAIILEPEGRNTAAAIATAAEWLVKKDPEAIMLVMPSDHVITRPAAFQAAIDAALPAVIAGNLATFGITPSSPQTGYGYIQMGSDMPATNGVKTVLRFVEKPDMATATGYVVDGSYVWNSGIFLLGARAYLAALTHHASAVAKAVGHAMENASTDGNFIRPAALEFKGSPNISIDYAVMEKTDKACVVPVDMGWSDVGSWDSLWDIGTKDAAGNLSVGDIKAIDCQNSLMRSEDGATVAAIGLKDMIIVATRDAVLVAPRERAQDVKLAVDALKADGRELHKFHSVVHRPWGTYQTTDLGERFQTKRIVVNPGAKLSLQMHHHRSEHWVVVRGTAKVTLGEDVFLLQENQSTYIPVGTVHRLENPGHMPLDLIEVQCGPYLGEDDIVRFEDSYGRVP